uniref:Molybdenum cofactor biosynthesis protein MoaB n=1 Tax=Ignisphaera aggregans TaxID=334771 RepID=A0A7J3Z6J9_9CREN
MPEREHETVRPFSLCFIVTSDSVVKGLKPDEIKPVAESTSSLCPDAVLRSYAVVGNSIEEIRSLVLEVINRCDVVMVTGGTGLSRRDVSIEAVKPIASKVMPGFGELFRHLSYRHVGIRAYLSRATAYVVGRALVFIVPGNPNAVRLALKDIICELSPHALYEIRR